MCRDIEDVTLDLESKLSRKIEKHYAAMFGMDQVTIGNGMLFWALE